LLRIRIRARDPAKPVERTPEPGERNLRQCSRRGEWRTRRSGRIAASPLSAEHGSFPRTPAASCCRISRSR
jgi:hypothetical protein